MLGSDVSKARRIYPRTLKESEVAQNRQQRAQLGPLTRNHVTKSYGEGCQDYELSQRNLGGLNWLLILRTNIEWYIQLN
jgi:hypothetical protein